MTKEELETAYNNILAIKDSCCDYDLTKPLEIPILPWREFNPKNILRPTMRAAIPHFETFEKSDFIGDRKLIDCIVEKVENGIVYTIEGNSGNSCRERQHTVGYYEILGYGIPAY